MSDLYTIYGTLDSEQARKVAAQLPTSIQAAIVEEVPATVRFPPPTDLDKYIPNPGMGRATRAVTKEMPEGSPTSPDNATCLQQHMLFWDFDGDGVIYPWDTYRGFRKLGYSRALSAFAIVGIHGAFSWPTLKHWLPHPFFPIYLDRANRTRHGSGSEVFDTEGRFVPQKFEEIFSKYDRDNKGGLSWRNIQEMVYNNLNAYDVFGWGAERLEWYATYLLLKDERGIVTKEKIRGMYDGSVWNVVAAEVAEKRAAKKAGKKVPPSDPGMEFNTVTQVRYDDTSDSKKNF